MLDEQSSTDAASSGGWYLGGSRGVRAVGRDSGNWRLLDREVDKSLVVMSRGSIISKSQVGRKSDELVVAGLRAMADLGNKRFRVGP